MRMIDDARAGKLDMIITKSITRFARNTVDSLMYLRILKEYKKNGPDIVK
jgi:site-specific DNA recombinase